MKLNSELDYEYECEKLTLTVLGCISRRYY